MTTLSVVLINSKWIVRYLSKQIQLVLYVQSMYSKHRNATSLPNSDSLWHLQCGEQWHECQCSDDIVCWRLSISKMSFNIECSVVQNARGLNIPAFGSSRTDWWKRTPNSLTIGQKHCHNYVIIFCAFALIPVHWRSDLVLESHTHSVALVLWVSVT